MTNENPWSKDVQQRLGYLTSLAKSQTPVNTGVKPAPPAASPTCAPLLTHTPLCLASKLIWEPSAPPVPRPPLPTVHPAPQAPCPGTPSPTVPPQLPHPPGRPQHPRSLPAAAGAPDPAAHRRWRAGRRLYALPGPSPGPSSPMAAPAMVAPATAAASAPASPRHGAATRLCGSGGCGSSAGCGNSARRGRAGTSGEGICSCL